MQLTQFYPVVQTDDVATTTAFFEDNFGFSRAFDSDWYVHLQNPEQPEVNLAVLAYDHPTLPVEGQHTTQGMIINFEVEDATAEDKRLRDAGLTLVKPLVDEPFGQRHAIFGGPLGILIDLVQVIPPSPEFLAGYSEGALPVQ